MARAQVPKRSLAVLAGCLLLAVVAAACGQSSPPGQSSAATPQSRGARPDSSVPAAAGGNQAATTVPAQVPRAAAPREEPREPAGVAPSISSPLLDINVVETGPSFLKVHATGTAPLSYAWFKEGRPELLGTEPELWFANPRVEDSGNYTVEVSNRWGKATATCRVTVNPRPK